ncbi:MAG: glycoside hydrolase family 127 protein [Pirellulales bacterium]|nr:glycoside hydrolase family 127 protein [Pirellulales bacterium]
MIRRCFYRLQTIARPSIGSLRGCRLTLLIAIGTLGIAAAVQSAEARRVAEPLVKPAFTPLPPGAVEPAGWLRDWALAAREGITGHLDEWSPVYRDGWKGIPIQAPGSRPDGAGWPLEQCAYWLDGALRLGYILHDDALIKKAVERLDLVVNGVNRGANSFIYWRKNPISYPADGFNSWACSHLGRALVGWYEASGNRRVLEALVRVYSQYPLPRDRFKLDDVSGICNLDPMLETYAFSGEKKILENALDAAKSPGVDATFRAWENRQYDPGHAVCAYEKLRLPILLYPWTGEDRYRQSSLRALEWVSERHMLSFGVASGMENLAGIGAFRLTETCDVAAFLWSAAWLYRIEGERTFGDGIERAFFNAGAAPIARDFQTMCYYQSPNRIESDTLPAEQPNAPGKGCLKFDRLAYPRVLCCVGAVNRLIPSYIAHLWMNTGDRGLAATLYGPCTVSATVGEKIPLKLTCQTAYPFEETVRITVDPGQKASFPLYFRIPAWCSGARLTLNGNSLDATPDAKGFVRIERLWSKGDLVELFFPMSVQIAQGYETEYPKYYRGYFNFKPDEVFEKRRFPYASVTCGPLLFALPIADEDPNTRVAEARWQFALDVEAERGAAEAEVERGPMPSKWDWPLAAPVAIKLPARVFDWKPSDVQALPAEPVEGAAAETIRLIPYGCTKFRISMFPVTKKAWGKQERE